VTVNNNFQQIPDNYHSRPDSQRLISLKISNILFALATILVVVGTGVSLVRLLGLMWVGHYNKLINPIIFLIASVFLYRRGSFLIDALSGTIFISTLMGIAVGALQHESKLRYFISHTFISLFMLAVYLAFSNIIWEKKRLSTIMGRMSFIISTSYFLVILAFYIINHWLGSSLYLGIGTGELSLPLAYYLIQSNWLGAGISATLILISGKRGAYLCLLAIALFFIPFPVIKNLFLRVLSTILAATLIICLTFAMQPIVDTINFPSTIQSVIDKWYLLNPLNTDEFNLGVASSGRSAEIRLAFARFNSSWINYFIGLGHGWFYFNYAEISGSETRNFFAHYVHFSPLNFIFTYGFIFGSLILGWIYRLLGESYSLLASTWKDKNPFNAIFIATIGLLAWGFSGYTYATDPILWIFLGILSSFTKNTQGQRHDS